MFRNNRLIIKLLIGGEMGQGGQMLPHHVGGELRQRVRLVAERAVQLRRWRHRCDEWMKAVHYCKVMLLPADSQIFLHLFR
jgi:hypothetical protein